MGFFKRLIMGDDSLSAGSNKGSKGHAPNQKNQKNERLNHTVPELIKMDAIKHKNALMAAGTIIFVVMFILYSSYFKAVFALAFLIAIGAASRVWQRFIPLEFGVELVMLSTVVSALAYGAFAGAAAGFLALSISTLFTQENPGKMWPSFFVIALMGVFSTALPIENISLLGVVLTVIYDALISIIYVGFMGARIINTLIFDITHIAFNYFVFFHIAPALLSAIA